MKTKFFLFGCDEILLDDRGFQIVGKSIHEADTELEVINFLSTYIGKKYEWFEIRKVYVKQ